jgi:hypothetical protein
MKKYIKEYLQLSEQEYEDKIFMYYWNWCYKYGGTESKTQELLANSAVNKWWLFEFQKLEKKFFESLEHLPKTTQALQNCYRANIVHIFTIYPKALIDGINPNNQIFKQNLITNTESVYAN